MTAVVPTVYPSLISRACAVLDEASVFKEAPDGYLRVILRIVKKINLKCLDAPIFASRAKLAEESGKSVETVHRVVRWLEERGLIERDQRARSELRGSSSPLVPTQKLLDALLLSEVSRASIDEPRPPSTSRALSTARPSDSPTMQDRKGGGFERVGKFRLPSDLAFLAKERGMSSSAVLHLMKLASLAKQRLSSIVLATRKYLEDLQGRELFAYLRALIGSGRDFGYRAKEEEQNAAEREEREYLKRKAEVLAGRTFKSSDEKLIVTVDSSGMLIELRDGRRAARPFCRAFLEAVQAGRLRGAQGVYI